MAVYVDTITDYGDIARSRNLPGTKWSHMMADSHEELMAFARQMRLSPSWLQHPGRPTEHFDLTPSRRSWALRLGAKERSLREMVTLARGAAADAGEEA